MAVRATNPCDNMNHTRRDAPVRHCPACGAVVNATKLVARVCEEPKHGAARRRQTRYCTDCGVQLTA